MFFSAVELCVSGWLINRHEKLKDREGLWKIEHLPNNQDRQKGALGIVRGLLKSFIVTQRHLGPKHQVEAILQIKGDKLCEKMKSNWFTQRTCNRIWSFHPTPINSDQD